MSNDRQTANVLTLELATMIVAIALAFASSLIKTFTFESILTFIFIVVIVIWFWWGYVMDRLAFPLRTNHFPLLDILVLILISLIPFTVQQGHIYYVSGNIGVLIIIWALLNRGIVQENSDIMDKNRKRALNLEVKGRLVVGFAFIFITVLSTFYHYIGAEEFVTLVFIFIVWNTFAERRLAERREALRKS